MLCRKCHVGRYQLAQIPFFCWFDDQIVLTPNVPALICDICGELVYDPAFVQNIQLLIEYQNSRQPESAVTPGPRLIADPAS